MKKIIKILLVLVLVFTLSVLLVGCNKAYNVQYNISQDADQFKTYRRVTVINLRSDNVLLQIEGYISIKDSTDSELAIVIRTGENEYKMHYVYIASEIVYLVEQLEPTSTDPYHWTINIYASLPDVVVG